LRDWADKRRWHPNSMRIWMDSGSWPCTSNGTWNSPDRNWHLALLQIKWRLEVPNLPKQSGPTRHGKRSSRHFNGNIHLPSLGTRSGIGRSGPCPRQGAAKDGPTQNRKGR
jgi:hypothetical protein